MSEVRPLEYVSEGGAIAYATLYRMAWEYKYC